MKVSEVMSRKVEIASPDDSIQRAAQMMARMRTSFARRRHQRDDIHAP